MSDTAPSIYSYDDFRLYLDDRYKERKQSNPAYSCRQFAGEAGFSNPGFLNDVIKGRRKLSDDATGKMIKAFSLSPTEADFFRILVAYGQAKKAVDKEKIYRKILFRRSRSAFSRMNPALSRYYQDANYPLVRAAIMALDFRGDYETLGRFVHPTIPTNQVKKYVRDLCEWGLVKQDKGGRYVVTQRFVEPPSTLNEVVRQLNRKWIQDAGEALMHLPPEKRHMSSMLLSVSPTTGKAIAHKLEQFRQEIWDLVKDDEEDPACIMQLNLQYFPRSKNKESS